MKLGSAAALVLSAALAAGCVAHQRIATPAASIQAPAVVDLRTLADLSAAFDRDRDHPRVVLLLSPT